MSTNTERIERIIAVRHQRTNGLKRKLEFLKRMEATVKRFDDLKNEIGETKQTGKGRFKLVLEKNRELAERVSGISVDSLRTKIEKQIEALMFLIRRFGRDSIQISVVGKARQGKSRLLQSISGLDCDVIPASDGGHCTGAKSVICNSNEPLKAKVIFYSQKELVQHVQKYLDILMPGKTIGRYTDIGKLDIKTDERLSAADDAKKGHLMKYIENFDRYSHLLEGDSELTIYDSRDIRKYVAQYGEDRTPYYNYLAVKEVQIFTSFNYKDAGKIVLVDTIGLGDTSIGIRDKMLNTLAEDSDAAIVMRLPSGLGDYIGTEDNEVIDMIQGRINYFSLDKWLFYVLNQAKPLKNENNAEELRKALEKKKQDGVLEAALIMTIDCSKPDEVEKKLIIPMLEVLSANLEEIDTGLMKRADRSGQELYSAYSVFMREVQNMLVKDWRNDVNVSVLLNELFETFYGSHLLGALLKKCREMYKNREETCDILSKRFNDITKFNPATIIPSVERIENELTVGGLHGIAHIVYTKFINELRTDFIQKFIKIDTSLNDIVDEFKKGIVELLTGKPRLGLIYPVNESKHPKEWLREFSENEMKGLDQLQFAFDFLYKFEISVRGFLMHKIRKHTDILDPSLTNQMPDLSGEETAKVISSELEVRLTLFRESLKRELRNFTQEPNEAFLAVLLEFYDRLAFASGSKDQWRQLYYANAGVVWDAEIKKEKELQIAFDEWQKFIDEVKLYNNRTQFTLT